jgi:hypothetical protein
MSDWCPTRAGCCSLPRPVDAERCNCTAPFADTHRPPPTFVDGTDRTMFSFGRGMGLAGWQRSRIPIVLAVASRPARELTVRSAKPGIKSALSG